MKRLVPIAIACLLAGFAAARWLPFAEPPPTPPGPAHFDRELPVAGRLLELEQAVTQERQARQLLQEELVYLTDELAYLTEELDEFRARLPADRSQAAATAPDAADSRPPRRRFTNSNSSDARIARLVDAGFAEDRAAWIVQRESEFQLDALNARHAAERSGNFEDYRALVDGRSQALRNDLGEVDYERYLAGTGRPTAIAISSVMDSSPAQRVGLLPGDEIVRYGSERIYSMNDLNRATLQGRAGETVYVEIVRDGITMQVSMPRGPLGITGGGRTRR